MYNKLIENFLTPTECNELIELGKKTNLQSLTSVTKDKDGNFVAQDDYVDYNKRKGSYFLNDDISSTNILSELANRTIKLLNELKPFKNGNYTNVDKFTFNEYSEGDFLKLHRDYHEIEFGATMTIIYQLNDNYDDGDIEYIIKDKKYILPKKQGSIFVFEPNVPHEVSTISNGLRYSMNAWPRFEENAKKTLF